MRDNEWKTPKWVLDLARLVDAQQRIALDPFPCVGSHVRPRRTMRDGLGRASWTRAAAGGLVWVNPPYSRDLLRHCVARTVAEAELGAHALLLVPSSTDVSWWHDCFSAAAQVCLLRGRIRFEGRADHGPLFPSCLFHFARQPAARARFARAFSPRGIVISAAARPRSKIRHTR